MRPSSNGIDLFRAYTLPYGPLPTNAGPPTLVSLKHFCHWSVLTAGRSENDRSFPTPGLDEASQSFAKDHQNIARLAELTGSYRDVTLGGIGSLVRGIYHL